MKARSDNREDYLINILRLYDGANPVKTNDIAKLMGVAPASVTEMMNVLQKGDLVVYEKYRGVLLTNLGLRTAKDLRRKHQIFERFLIEILDIDPDTAHSEACSFEHSISNVAADRLCRIIGKVDDDVCDCCSNVCSRSSKTQLVSRCLNEMKSGDYSISYISSDDRMTIKDLIHLGLVPGKNITVAEVEGRKSVVCEGSIHLLDTDLASSIFVISDERKPQRIFLSRSPLSWRNRFFRTEPCRFSR